MRLDNPAGTKPWPSDRLRSLREDQGRKTHVIRTGLSATEAKVPLELASSSIGVPTSVGSHVAGRLAKPAVKAISKAGHRAMPLVAKKLAGSSARFVGRYALGKALSPVAGKINDATTGRVSKARN